MANASASPSQQVQGGTVMLTGSAISDVRTPASVTITVYDASNNAVFSQTFKNQPFNAGQMRSFSASYQVQLTALPGTYTVRVDVNSVDGKTDFVPPGHAQSATFTVV